MVDASCPWLNPCYATALRIIDVCLVTAFLDLWLCLFSCVYVYVHIYIHVCMYVCMYGVTLICLDILRRTTQDQEMIPTLK